MNTGMRAGEIRQFQWVHADLKVGVFRLPREITKTKRARVVPITPEVVEAINSLPRHLHGYVVTCKGRPLAGLSGVTTPLFSVAFGLLFLGEIITTPIIVGSVLLLIGMLWLNRF
jgi:integrase